MDRLRAELEGYYDQYAIGVPGRPCPGFPDENLAVRRAILGAMDEYADSHPDEHPSLLKARLHEEMAERFEPVIFRWSPFFWEMGLRFSENWGTPCSRDLVVGSWLRERRRSEVWARPEMADLQRIQSSQPAPAPRIWSFNDEFDSDHHCIGYTRLLRTGLNGVIDEIHERREKACSIHQAANLEAMARSCRAMIRVAQRFSEKAASMASGESDETARRFLTMIAQCASRIPAEPPRNFYEGLAMLWFLREATATLEAVGISVVGHPDRQLIGLYRADLSDGRVTADEVRDLLARWMLPTDVKFHVQNNPWPETSTCMELGGCDEDGAVVWNDLTRLIIETHHAHGLMNPKLNCRYDARSPQAYLDLISEKIIAGHNHFALLNDDVLIPAMQRAGKTLPEARLYVNGGCQEPMCEGVEHTAGAYYYFNMARTLDLCLREDALPDDFPTSARRAIPEPIPTVDDFELFYRAFMDRLLGVIRVGAEWAVSCGKDQWRVHPCPFLSSTLAGCIENGMDYSQGGAKYNPSGIALVGLATVVDSLYALKRAVFDDGWVGAEEMRACLERNWDGYEELRSRIRLLPRYGHGDAEVDVLAARMADEISAFAPTVPNERGGSFQASFFVYYAFHSMAGTVRATPDGRRDGELLSQGIAPDRTTSPGSLSDVFHSLSHIDFRGFPANAVLDAQMPAGRVPAEVMSATIRAFSEMGGPTLQINCVSVDDLRDAKARPERHRDLIVRISGLSAHFVCLDPHVQDEIISRAVMQV